MPTADDRFKHQLGPALDLWVSEDLITREQARRLRSYYQLDELAQVGQGRFGAVLLAFGGILVGLGVISFVAANWAAISPATRASCGLLLMLAVDVAGFRLWQRPGSHRLGSALLLLGGMGLGGNIALMAQWFQIGGSGWGLFLAWGVGTLAMAVGLRHGLMGALSGIVMMCCAVSVPEAWHWAFLWVFMLVYVPLAIWCDSRVTLWAGLVGIFGVVFRLGAPLGLVAGTFSMGVYALGLWAWASWQDRLLARRPSVRTYMSPDQDALVQAQLPRFIGALLLVAGMQFFGFGDAWKQSLAWEPTPWYDNASLATFLVLTLVAWAGLVPAGSQRWPHLGLGVIVFLGSELVALGGMVVPANVLLLLTVLGFAWLGLVRAERGWFWLGVLGLTFQVFARFLEYDTDLLAKSAVFTAWGVMLLAVGWRFERRMARHAREVADARGQ